MISYDELKELLTYCPETGIFRWNVNGLKRKKGKIAGGFSGGRRGQYICIRVNYKRYYAHILAWFYMTGRWPENQIDHWDNDPTNNKWLNLREATNQQNQGNRSINKNNTSGYKGVVWFKNSEGWSSWAARIWYNGKIISLGYFNTKEEAAIAYNKAAIKYFGKYARLNDVDANTSSNNEPKTDESDTG